MEPAAIRHKNPGAMWPGDRATRWGSKRWVYLNDGTGQGGNGKGNKIAIFENHVDGICAQLDLWRTSKNYRNKPFKDAIRIWSGGNHVESYIAFVLKRIPGMTRNTIMNDAFWNSPMGIDFLKVQAWHEAGKRYPAPHADYVEAQRRVFVKSPPKVSPQPKEKITNPEKPEGEIEAHSPEATYENMKDADEQNTREDVQNVPFWKRPFMWLGTILSGGMIGGSLSVDAQFMWGLSGFVVIMFILLVGWVYIIPPRGAIRKGLD